MKNNNASGTLEVASGELTFGAANTELTAPITVKNGATLKLATPIGTADANKSLPDGKTITVEEGGVCELVSAYGYFNVTGAGTTKVTGTGDAVLFGIGGVNNTISTTTLEVVEGAKLGIRPWNSARTMTATNLIVNGTIVKNGGDRAITMAGTTVSGKGTVETGLTINETLVADGTNAITATGDLTLPAALTVALPEGFAATTDGTVVLKKAGATVPETVTLKAGETEIADALLVATAEGLAVQKIEVVVPAGVEAPTAEVATLLTSIAKEQKVAKVEAAVDSAKPIEAATLFDGVTNVMVDAGTAKVAVDYDFGIDKMTVRKDGDVLNVYIRAKVQKDAATEASFATGTAVKLYNGDEEVTGEEAAPAGITPAAGEKWIKVPLTTFPVGNTAHLKVKASK